MSSIRPPYNTAAPAEWEPVSPPPYDFLGVTMRVFPLPADLRQLQDFCDSYLNLVPPEVGVFRPSVPMVLLVLVDYGKMVSEVRQIGWVSQRETAFVVPLAWMRKEGGEEDGKEVFVDWASVAPYIFVDQPMSVATGREVYGWPKEMGWFEPGIDSWTDVRYVESFKFRLSTQVRPHLPPVPGEGIHPLYTIRQVPTAPVFSWPPSPDTVLNPFRTLEHLLRASDRLMSTAAGVLGSAFRYGPQSWGESAKVATEMLAAVWPLADSTRMQKPVSNTINLKQFRDAKNPRAVAYQALTNARMTGLRYGTTSLLGAPQVMSGDPSGGHRIEIHSYPCYPVVEHLGLLGERTREDLHRIRPLFPFKIDLDLRYEAGEILAWRSKHFGWSCTTEPGPRLPATSPLPRYNTTLGKHEAPLPGSFSFPNVTWRLLALRADPQQLQRLADELVNDAYESVGGTRPFRATMPWVLLGAINFCSVSPRGEVNCWRDREVAFYVPVERTAPGAADGEDRDEDPELWFLAPVVFSNNEIAVITLREVLGLPVSYGSIVSPQVEWMAAEPNHAQRLVEVHTEVVTDTDADTPQSEHVVLSVVRGDPSLEAQGAGSKPQGNAGSGTSKEDRKSYERIVQQVQKDGLLRLATLKQFRDVHNPHRACFQGLVEQTVRLQVRRSGDLEGPLSVRIRSYPSQPIVDTLGLEVARTEPASPAGSPGDGKPAVDVLAPHGAFWLQASMEHVADDCRDVFPPGPPEKETEP